MSDIDFILDGMTWSYSRLSSFDTCPYEWYQNYVECDEDNKENNAYAETGLCMHETLEAFAKHEIDVFDLNDYYEKLFFENVIHDFPRVGSVDQRQAQFDEAMDFFNNLSFDEDKYEILGVEKKVEFTIAGHKFIGFIDLLLRDRESGEIIILDHKSAKIKILKSGKVSKSDQEHFLGFKRQLYLYSKAIIEEYGKVDKLSWNLFRTGNILTIPWVEEEYKEAVQWAIGTIDIIYVAEEFEQKPDYFYCANLCGYRFACDQSPRCRTNEEYAGEIESDGWGYE